MAQRKSTSSEKLPPPSLVESRPNAYQKLQTQIEKGQQIRNRSINSKEELEEARAERSKWSKYNAELLLRLFDNSSISDEYSRSFGGGYRSKPQFFADSKRISRRHG